MCKSRVLVFSEICPTTISTCHADFWMHATSCNKLETGTLHDSGVCEITTHAMHTQTRLLCMLQECHHALKCMLDACHDCTYCFFLSPVTQEWWQQIAAVHAMHADANACSCTTDTGQQNFCLQKYISTCERRDMSAFKGHFTVIQPSQALMPAHRTTMLPQTCLTAKAAIL